MPSFLKYLLSVPMWIAAAAAYCQYPASECGAQFQRSADRLILERQDSPSETQAKKDSSDYVAAQKDWEDCLAGSTLPSFSFKDSNGREINADSLKDKVVLIQFWEPLCPPCMAEIEVINELVSAFKEEGVLFLTIGNCNKGKVQAITRFHSIFIPSSAVEIQKFGVIAYPTILIVSKKNTISKVFLGANMSALEAFKAELFRALKEELNK